MTLTHEQRLDMLTPERRAIAERTQSIVLELEGSEIKDRFYGDDLSKDQRELCPEVAKNILPRCVSIDD